MKKLFSIFLLHLLCGNFMYGMESAQDIALLDFPATNQLNVQEDKKYLDKKDLCFCSVAVVLTVLAAVFSLSNKPCAFNYAYLALGGTLTLHGGVILTETLRDYLRNNRENFLNNYKDKILAGELCSLGGIALLALGGVFHASFC